MVQTDSISVGTLQFRCRTAGEKNGIPIFFLHGFPESSIMWQGIMDAFSKEGYYCIAPDMRGYSEGACPTGKKNYTVSQLSADIIGIANALSIDKFHLVGHDWGAAVGWNTVHEYPERIISWSALSIPHNRAFAKALRTDPEQKKKSRYIGWFLLPYIPEIMIRRGDFRTFRKLWKRSSTQEVDDYLSIFKRKKSLTGALNYYRANIGRGKAVRLGEIETPTLFIWGNRDLAIGSTAAHANEKYLTGPYTFVEIEAGHWLIQEKYDEVKSALLKHIQNYN